MSSYLDFVATKFRSFEPSGFESKAGDLPSGTHCLFPFQESLVLWALRRGRAAIFADTGLGKSFMQAAWARMVFQNTGNRVLILSPLCVAPQTVAEANKLGVPITYYREPPENLETGVWITNYELLDKFADLIKRGFFDGIVLDESSILKHQDSKTRTRIIELCRDIPYKLSCTATPSPNDFMELGNQAEFLGVMSHVEMLATFFVHDGGETQKWRLKGHGKTKFWEWLSTWAAVIKKPSDLGFDDDGYSLPPLKIEEKIVVTGDFVKIAETLSERNAARRDTIEARVKEAVLQANQDKDQRIIWCNLNDESALLAEQIDGAVEVRGSHSPIEKEKRIAAFTTGAARVLVTKPSIAGFGMNWQHCHKMTFVGLNDSYEQLYQAIRRCYRFGQIHSVEVTLISADKEGAVLENIKRKEAQAIEMGDAMIAHMREFTKREVVGTSREVANYKRDTAQGKGWTLELGDCVEIASGLPDHSVDFTVFSPPFASLYTYSNSDRDMGNCSSHDAFYSHFEFLVKQLFRITKPGRLVSFHCMNLPTSKTRDGYIGIRDFRGELIRMFQRAGFIFHSEVGIWKDPVVAMQRTKALGLLWKQLKKDSSMSRQGIPDYLVTMRAPGVNLEPITHTEAEFPVSDWQHYASPFWMDIKPSNTLNGRRAREEDDERHICPLQLDLIERALFMWSNPNDLVFSPFAGIGSEGFVSLKMGRRFLGAELKESYWKVAIDNLKAIENAAPDLTIPKVAPAKFKQTDLGEEKDKVIFSSCDEQRDLFTSLQN